MTSFQMKELPFVIRFAYGFAGWPLPLYSVIALKASIRATQFLEAEKRRFGWSHQSITVEYAAPFQGNVFIDLARDESQTVEYIVTEKP